MREIGYLPANTHESFIEGASGDTDYAAVLAFPVPGKNRFWRQESA